MTDSRHSVLFVDDTADTRSLVEWSLRQDGFDITTAQTAEQGLNFARANSYSLILLDIGLPDKDGLELCREIRAFNPDTPILFYTAFADLLEHKKAIEAGAQGCLRKPEDTTRLATAIRALVEKA